jgi:hypothetical protein
MTTNMQTALCGKIPCFRPGTSAKTTKPQLSRGTADPAIWTTGESDPENEESIEPEDGLTREDLMDVLSLYLF